MIYHWLGLVVFWGGVTCCAAWLLWGLYALLWHRIKSWFMNTTWYGQYLTYRLYKKYVPGWDAFSCRYVQSKINRGKIKSRYLPQINKLLEIRLKELSEL